MNVLFVQDSSPCIRNIKYAEALYREGVKVHLLHKNKSPDQNYGYGNEFYASLTRFSYHYKAVKLVKNIASENCIDVIHYHNQPDLLCARILKQRHNVPVIWDCHDLMSLKHKLYCRSKLAEKACAEKADGVIFPTESYMRQTGQLYNLPKHKIAYGNYFPQKHLLNTENFLAKKSKDGFIHIVFQGRLAEKKSDHRYIADYLKSFDISKYRLHLYPSNRKEFSAYKSIPKVILHNRLPYEKLINEISSYDLGLVLFNDSTPFLKKIVEHAFGNKAFDYMCAGLPILVQDTLTDIREFVMQHKIGFVLSGLSSMDFTDLQSAQANVLKIREQYSMEFMIKKLLAFYKNIIGDFNAR